MNKLFDFDKKELSSYKYLLGTDEAGRGPGAGPVFAACVCFKNPDKTLIKDLSLLNDSKQLTEKIRNELYPIIIENSIYSIHQGSVEDIEKYNILRTSLNTMKKCALEAGEGCLSVDDPHPGLVHRSYKIKMEAYDALQDENIVIVARGFEAIVLQHEFDHLNGMFYYDHIDKANPGKKLLNEEIL